MEFIASLPDEMSLDGSQPIALLRVPANAVRDSESKSRHNSLPNSKLEIEESTSARQGAISPHSPKPKIDLDYGAAVGTLTLHFLNEHEATRVAALTWLIMLHQKAPRKVLATNDGTFPALLKTLSDPAEAVVTRDLQLLSQISRNSEDGYFTSFMVNLLQLFCTDRRLLETRGNLIIRQLCLSLSAERIYRTLADCLEKDEVRIGRTGFIGSLRDFQDVEFASIMVQNLNNNLITAPELSELRKRLRSLETRVRYPGLLKNRVLILYRRGKPFLLLSLDLGVIMR
jgi:vacuole morphology and inheritance protein 14